MSPYLRVRIPPPVTHVESTRAMQMNAVKCHSVGLAKLTSASAAAKLYCVGPGEWQKSLRLGTTLLYWVARVLSVEQVITKRRISYAAPMRSAAPLRDSGGVGTTTFTVALVAVPVQVHLNAMCVARSCDLQPENTALPWPFVTALSAPDSVPVPVASTPSHHTALLTAVQRIAQLHNGLLREGHR